MQLFIVKGLASDGARNQVFMPLNSIEVSRSQA